MRVRVSLLAGVGVAALIMTAAIAPIADAGGAAVRPGSRPAAICDQSQQTSVGNGLNSQRYLQKGQTLTDMGAADFKILGSCTITQVNVVGHYVGGSGPTPSVNISIRAGNLNPSGPNLANPALDNNITTTGEQLPSSPGVFQTVLPGPVALSAGHYWVIFQVNLNPSSGQWIWDMTTFGAYQPDQWRNPSGGWGCGTAWIPLGFSCFGVPAKGLIFQIIS